MGGEGGALLYPHQLPSFAFLCKPKFGNPKPVLPIISFFNLAELADHSSFSSIRAEGNGERRRKAPMARSPKAEGLEENHQSVDGRSPLSPNKENILALFKRIQASISKGETMDSKKKNSKIADEKPSAEAILEVLHQSRTPGKVKRVGKSPATRKISPGKDEGAVHSPTLSLKSTRPPSSFMRKSPIPTLLSPSDKAEQENEAMPTTPSPSIPEEEIVQKPEKLPAMNSSNVDKFSEFKEMNLVQLKEVAKAYGIRGYTKLKKGELVQLLTRSLNNTCP